MLDRGLRLVLCDRFLFEGGVFLGILQGRYDSLGGQPVPEGILARSQLSLLGSRPGAFERIPAIGRDLLCGGHLRQAVVESAAAEPWLMVDCRCLFRLSSQSCFATPKGSILKFCHQVTSWP